mgnify:FL=1
MDVSSLLTAIAELVTSPNVSAYIRADVVTQIISLLKSPTRTIPRVESVLYNAKLELNITAEYQPGWVMFENIVFHMFTLQSESEIISYLTKEHHELQSYTQGVSNTDIPTRTYSLNQQNLNASHSGQDRLIAPSVYAESFETIDKFSDRRSMQSSQYNRQTQSALANTTLKNVSDPLYKNTIEEEDVLAIISYTLLGITCEMFPITNDQITIPNSIPNSMSSLLHLLFEGGLIYKSITQRIDYYKHVHISPLKQTLRLEIEKFLNEYSGLVNILATSNPQRTLNNLYLKLYDSIMSLRVYYYIMEKFPILRGDELLSLFHSSISHGDKLIHNIASHLFHSLISLYFTYMKEWITMGKLDDSYAEEFFIKRTDIQPKHNFIIPYAFENAKVPKFIAPTTAYNIFIIGKSYIFLTTFCKELEWANEFTKNCVAQLTLLKTHSSTFSSDFDELIANQYMGIVKQSLRILKSKYQYVSILDMLKSVLLMGRNDFIDVIFLKSDGILSQPIRQLKNYAFTRVLQESIEQSSLRSLLKNVDGNMLLEKIDARLLNMGNDLQGWDVFTLDYVLYPPLSIVLNVNRMDGRKEYLQIFNFLWRFKRLDFFNNNSMIGTKRLIHSFKKNTRFSPFARDITGKLSKLSILRSRIQQFNSKLEMYYSVHIIEKNFVELKESLHVAEECSAGVAQHAVQTTQYSNGSIQFEGILKPSHDLTLFGITDSEYMTADQPNIEDLFTLHNAFLERILSHPLFSSSSVGKHSQLPYARSLVFIFEEMQSFADSNRTLSDIAYNIFLQLNLHNHAGVNSEIAKFNEASRRTVYHFKRFQRAAYTYIADMRDDGSDELRKLSRMLR